MTSRRTAVLVTVVAVLVLIAAGLIARHLEVPGSTTAPEASPSASPAPAGGTAQVHLGDSFAAGTGLQPLVEGSPYPCLRAQGNFGQLLAERFGRDLTDVSCAGATTDDLRGSQYDGTAPQLDALSPRAELVTLMLGGNDGDVYATAVGECTRLGRTDPSGDPCRRAVGDTLLKRLDAQTRPALEEGLREVVRRAPNARVLIAGYPAILPAAGGCFGQVPIAAGDIAFMNRLQQRLNDVVETAATAAGAAYVDLTEVSAGHDACAAPSQRWVEPVTGGPASLHPNARGQRGIAAAVAARLAS
ncbi:SGNH/GDSL hydrolase family protein [Gordonia caeni]|uniref:SGNH/GDSL hydrolase family protein n=1 Tax=Gordonia caeni TaxID=1007097 RepID=A0ABP7NP72_9ACTN